MMRTAKMENLVLEPYSQNRRRRPTRGFARLNVYPRIRRTSGVASVEVVMISVMQLRTQEVNTYFFTPRTQTRSPSGL
jgi:hypothetical protein